MRGRKPKPVELREGEGNRGHRRIPEAPKVSGSPAVPPGLSEGERVEWDRVVEFMRVMGTLSADSGATIEIHVRNLVRLRSAEAHISEHGMIVAAPRTGLPMQNPHLRIAERSAALILKTASELGLTPSAHSRVRGDEDLPGDYAGLSKEELLAERERIAKELEKETASNRRTVIQ